MSGRWGQGPFTTGHAANILTYPSVHGRPVPGPRAQQPANVRFSIRSVRFTPGAGSTVNAVLTAAVKQHRFSDQRTQHDTIRILDTRGAGIEWDKEAVAAPLIE